MLRKQPTSARRASVVIRARKIREARPGQARPSQAGGEGRGRGGKREGGRGGGRSVGEACAKLSKLAPCRAMRARGPVRCRAVLRSCKNTKASCQCAGFAAGCAARPNCGARRRPTRAALARPSKFAALMAGGKGRAMQGLRNRRVVEGSISGVPRKTKTTVPETDLWLSL